MEEKNNGPLTPAPVGHLYALKVLKLAPIVNGDRGLSGPYRGHCRRALSVLFLVNLHDDLFELIGLVKSSFIPARDIRILRELTRCRYKLTDMKSSEKNRFSEIGVDMAQFGSSKRLCCWAGLTRGSNESAGKKKSVRISRAGVYLKPALVQAAHAAVKDKTNPYWCPPCYPRCLRTLM